MNTISKDSNGRYQLEQSSDGIRKDKIKLVALIGAVTLSATAIYAAGALSHKYIFSAKMSPRVSIEHLPQEYRSIFEFPAEQEQTAHSENTAFQSDDHEILDGVRDVIEVARSTNYATVLILDKFLKKIDKSPAVDVEARNDDMKRALRVGVASLNHLADRTQQLSSLNSVIAQEFSLQQLAQNPSETSVLTEPDSPTHETKTQDDTVVTPQAVSAKREKTLTEKFAALNKKMATFRKSETLKQMQVTEQPLSVGSEVDSIQRKNWVVAEGESMTHMVRRGESLAILAKKFYGDPLKYTAILEANNDKLSDPEKIREGMYLVIPGVKKVAPFSVSLAD